MEHLPSLDPNSPLASQRIGGFNIDRNYSEQNVKGALGKLQLHSRRIDQ